MVSDLGVDDQEGDHSMFFQVGVPTLPVSGLHLIWAFQMLQCHWRDVNPPGDETGKDKRTDDERLRACAIVPLTALSNVLFTSQLYNSDLQFSLSSFVCYPCKQRWMEMGSCVFSGHICQIPFSRHKRRQTISSPVRQCGGTGELIFSVAYTQPPANFPMLVTVLG